MVRTLEDAVDIRRAIDVLSQIYEIPDTAGDDADYGDQGRIAISILCRAWNDRRNLTFEETQTVFGNALGSRP